VAWAREQMEPKKIIFLSWARELLFATAESALEPASLPKLRKTIPHQLSLFYGVSSFFVSGGN